MAASNAAPISVNASVSEAAAKIVNVCGSGAAVGGTTVNARVGASAAGAGVGVVEAPQAVKKMDRTRIREGKRFKIKSPGAIWCGVDAC